MTDNDPPQGPGLPEDARLSSLDERLRRAQQAEADRSGVRRPDPNFRRGPRGRGAQIGAPFGGGLNGWLLDPGLETSPLFLLSMLFLGFAVGIRNIVRLSRTPPGNGPGAG